MLLLIRPRPLVLYRTPDVFGSCARPTTPPTLVKVFISVQVAPASVLRLVRPLFMMYILSGATGSMSRLSIYEVPPVLLSSTEVPGSNMADQLWPASVDL